MRLFMIVLSTVLAINYKRVECEGRQAQREIDADAIRRCLPGRNAKELYENVQKVKRYGSWRAGEEEVPCFTRCITAERGWYDIEGGRWHRHKIADDLGADMYNYCRNELNRNFVNACEMAYKGLRCLKQAETAMSKTIEALSHCSRQLNVSMLQLHEYALLPDEEVMPCLFKCFAEQLNLYTPDYDWNVDNWLKAFGPFKHENYELAVASACNTNAKKIRTGDKCTLMYEEFICVERLEYNARLLNGPPMPTSTMTTQMKT